jgi:hypothetical protein
MNVRMVLEEDSTALLERALLGETVCAFGEDGFGKHGKNSFASWYVVSGIDVNVVDVPIVHGTVTITLHGYNSDVTGLVMTDKNLEISLGAHLKAAGIDAGSLEWQEDTDSQGTGSVTMNINFDLLFGWK